jgi:acyl dehydratase
MTINAAPTPPSTTASVVLQPTVDPATLAPGTPLPGWEHQFTEVDLVAYGAATWDWHRVHYDLAYAKSRKLPGVLIDGQVYGAIFAKLATRWAGPGAFLSGMGLKMRSMAFAGDALRAEGEVRSVESLASGDQVQLSQRLLCGDRLIAEALTTLRFSKR